MDKNARLFFEELAREIRAWSNTATGRVTGEYIQPEIGERENYDILRKYIDTDEKMRAFREVVRDTLEDQMFSTLKMIDDGFGNYPDLVLLSIVDRETREDILPGGGYYSCFTYFYDHLTEAGDEEAPEEPTDSAECVNQEARPESAVDVFSAARAGEERLVRDVLDRTPDLVHATDRSGITLLRWAALKGHERIVGLLISRGANVDAVEKGGWTPLHWAAREGHSEITELLLAGGADVDARNEESRTPLHLAAEKNSTSVMRLLITHGADVSAQDWNDWTPLHEAALHSHRDAAELLIAAGADAEAKDKALTTPLHVAASSGSIEIAEMLIERGVDINARDIVLNTPVTAAANEEMRELLRRHRAERGWWKSMFRRR